MDMREAQRSYQANLKVMETTRGLAAKLLEVLRG
jgi:flagellar basal body rod protein FlgC